MERRANGVRGKPWAARKARAAGAGTIEDPPADQPARTRSSAPVRGDRCGAEAVQVQRHCGRRNRGRHRNDHCAGASNPETRVATRESRHLKRWIGPRRTVTIVTAATPPGPFAMRHLLLLLCLIAVPVLAQDGAYAGRDDALRAIDSAEPERRADAIRWIASHGTPDDAPVLQAHLT